LEPTPSLEPQVGSQLPKATLHPEDAAGSHLPEAASGPMDQESTGLDPMEVDPPDPLRRVRTIQCPIYFISEVLDDVKTRYLEVHKLLYAVFIALRKLHHYFRAHKILVVTSYPAKVMLHNPNATGNNVKWVTELAEFELYFLPRHAVKS
jgi:hypothetical protein